MFNNIFRTVFVKIFAALVSFAIILLNAKYIGAEGVGVISIIILDISLIALLSGIIAGPAVVYYTSRKLISQLYLSSFIWIVFVIAFILIFNKILNNYPEVQNYIFPESYFRDILILSVIQSFIGLNLSILLGKEKIKSHNIINSLQFFVLILSVIYYFYFQKNHSVQAYLNSYYFAVVSSLAISSMLVIKEALKESFSLKISSTFKDVFKYGMFSQPASILQLLNYRIPYYFLSKYVGLNQLGIYSTANQVSEGLWIFSKSVSLVQYSKISNTNDKKYNIDLSIKLLKLSILITLIPILILVSIPEKAILYALGNNDFEGIKNVIYFLSPGILALVIKMILAHYFAGIGKPKFNMYASGFSLIIAIISSLILIPKFGINGAAITATITYISGAAIEFYYFRKSTACGYKILIISKSDIKYAFNFILHYFKVK